MEKSVAGAIGNDAQAADRDEMCNLTEIPDIPKRYPLKKVPRGSIRLQPSSSDSLPKSERIRTKNKSDVKNKSEMRDFYKIIEENHKNTTCYDLKNDVNVQVKKTSTVADDYFLLDKAVRVSEMMYDSLDGEEQKQYIQRSKLYEIYGFKPSNDKNVKDTCESYKSSTIQRKTTVYERAKIPCDIDDSIITCLAFYEGIGGIESINNHGGYNHLKKDIYEKCLKIIYNIPSADLSKILDFINNMWRGNAGSVFEYIGRVKSFKTKDTYLRSSRRLVINELPDIISDVQSIISDHFPLIEYKMYSKDDIDNSFKKILSYNYHEDIIVCLQTYISSIRILICDTNISSTWKKEFDYSAHSFEMLSEYISIAPSKFLHQSNIRFVEDIILSNLIPLSEYKCQNTLSNDSDLISSELSQSITNRLERYRVGVSNQLYSVFFPEGYEQLKSIPLHMYRFVSYILQRIEESTFRNRCDDAFFLTAYSLTKGVDIHVYCLGKNSKRVVLGKKFQSLEHNNEVARDLSLFYNKGKYDILMEYVGSNIPIDDVNDATSLSNNNTILSPETVRPNTTSEKSFQSLYLTLRSFNASITRSYDITSELKRWAQNVNSQINTNCRIRRSISENTLNNTPNPSCNINRTFKIKIEKQIQLISKRQLSDKVITYTKYKHKPQHKPAINSLISDSISASSSSEGDDSSSDPPNRSTSFVRIDDIKLVYNPVYYNSKMFNVSWSNRYENGVYFSTMSDYLSNISNSTTFPNLIENKDNPTLVEKIENEPNGNFRPRTFILSKPDAQIRIDSQHVVKKPNNNEDKSSTPQPSILTKPYREKMIICANMYLDTNFTNSIFRILSYEVAIQFSRKKPNQLRSNIIEKCHNYDRLSTFKHLKFKNNCDYENYNISETNMNSNNAEVTSQKKTSFKISDNILKSRIMDAIFKKILQNTGGDGQLKTMSDRDEEIFDVVFQVWSSFCKIELYDFENVYFIVNDDIIVNTSLDNRKSSNNNNNLSSSGFSKKIFDMGDYSRGYNDTHLKNRPDDYYDSDYTSEDGSNPTSSESDDSGDIRNSSRSQNQSEKRGNNLEDSKVFNIRRHPKIINTDHTTIDGERFSGVNEKLPETIHHKVIIEVESRRRRSLSLWLPLGSIGEIERNIINGDKLKTACSIRFHDLCTGTNPDKDKSSKLIQGLFFFDIFCEKILKESMNVGHNVDLCENMYHISIPVLEDRPKYSKFGEMDEIDEIESSCDNLLDYPKKYYQHIIYANKLKMHENIIDNNDVDIHNDHKVSSKIDPVSESNGSWMWGLLFNGDDVEKTCKDKATQNPGTKKTMKRSRNYSSSSSSSPSSSSYSSYSNSSNSDDILENMRNKVGDAASSLKHVGGNFLKYVASSGDHDVRVKKQHLRRCLNIDGYLITVWLPEDDDISSVKSKFVNSEYLTQIQSIFTKSLDII